MLFACVCVSVGGGGGGGWEAGAVLPFISDANSPAFGERETDLPFFASSPSLPLWYINLPLFTSTINIEYLVKNKTDLV